MIRLRLAKLLLLPIFLFFAVTNVTNSAFVDQDTIIGNTVSAGDWEAPPVPQLISPGNNVIINSVGLIQTWEQVEDNFPGNVWYDYQSFSDPGLTILRFSAVYTNTANGNGLVITKNAAGAPNGHVYWRVRARDVHGNTSAWTGPWHFEILNSTPSPTPDSVSTPSASIVLNEILPDPSGSDTAPKPNGEWVELYNLTGSDLSVAGWTVEDAVANTVTIIGAITNRGDTTVPALGYLVVYLGGTPVTLDNNGDTVKLFNAAHVQQDSFTYGSTPTGKSIARIPDGSANWVDPIPTPGYPNVGDVAELEPLLHAEKQGSSHLKLTIVGGVNYENLSYEVVYEHLGEDDTHISESFSGSTSITEFETVVDDLFFGTSSDGVETAHESVRNISVTVILSGAGIPDRTLTAELETVI